ncbi:MAG: 30S ribosomal protein S20 [Verrucomicrobiota bacterium]|jgi:small subunit ribosomal protein S20|nr:30S ribosomal protein S20 [Verrucomicrobiota bacterium]
MPNIKSAIKRVKTAEKSRKRNSGTKSQLKTLRKNLLNTVDGEDMPKTQEAYAAYCSALDKGVKHGIVHKNTAIRKKNRVGAMVRKAAAK